jgi:PPOX class probable F420-dependent enzyme
MQLDEKARAFLQEKRFAVLATVSASGEPQQTVMWYDLDGDTILMNTSGERVKAHNLRRNPVASICVEDEYHYVTIAGEIQLVEDRETALRDIKRLALRYHEDEQVAEKMMQDFAKQPRVTLRLTPKRVLTRF